MALRISSQDFVGELEVPGALKGTLSSGSITKNETRKNSSGKKKPSRKIHDNQKSAGRKDSEDTTPTELTKEHRAVF